MKVVIIEDEQSLARALFSKLKKLRPGIEIVDWTTNIRDSVNVLKAHADIDIVFADIKIDDGLSFSIFEQVTSSAMVVFTTAYDEYALKAFDYNCADYLLKPISDDHLERALCKCEKGVQRISPAAMSEMSAAVLGRTVQYRKRLLLEKGTDMIITDVNDLSHVFTEKGYTRAFLRDGTWASVGASLLELSDSLDPGCFLRANRQTIVNINCIAKISPGSVREYLLLMKEPWSETEIPISPEKKKELMSVL